MTPDLQYRRKSWPHGQIALVGARRYSTSHPIRAVNWDVSTAAELLGSS
jgi:hypothetical protein